MKGKLAQLLLGEDELPGLHKVIEMVEQERKQQKKQESVQAKKLTSEPTQNLRKQRTKKS